MKDAPIVTCTAPGNLQVTGVLFKPGTEPPGSFWYDVEHIATVERNIQEVTLAPEDLLREGPPEDRFKYSVSKFYEGGARGPIAPAMLNKA
eukprot:1755881-Lingulodinium_polyedra.AAC.1